MAITHDEGGVMAAQEHSPGVSWQTFSTLRAHYGNSSSWAVWAADPVVRDPRSKIRGAFDEPALFEASDSAAYEAALAALPSHRKLRSDVVLVPLNFAERDDGVGRSPLAAFHEIAYNDEKLRLGIQAAGLEGCYITDLVKAPVREGPYLTSPLRLTDSGQVKVRARGDVVVPRRAVADMLVDGDLPVGLAAAGNVVFKGRNDRDADSEPAVTFNTLPMFFQEVDALAAGRGAGHTIFLIPVGSAVRSKLDTATFRRLVEQRCADADEPKPKLVVVDGYLPHYSDYLSAEAYVEKVCDFVELVAESVDKNGLPKYPALFRGPGG